MTTKQPFTDLLFERAEGRIMAKLKELYPGQKFNFEDIKQQIKGLMYKADPTSSINMARLDAETYRGRDGKIVVPDFRPMASWLKKLGFHYQLLETSDIPNASGPLAPGVMAPEFLRTAAGEDIAQALQNAPPALMQFGNTHMVVMTELYRELETQIKGKKFEFLGPRGTQEEAERALDAKPEKTPDNLYKRYGYRLVDSSGNFGKIDDFFSRYTTHYRTLDAVVAMNAEKNRQGRPLEHNALKHALNWFGEAGTLPEFRGGGPTGRFKDSFYRDLYEKVWDNPIWNVNDPNPQPYTVKVPSWWGETVAQAAVKEAGIPPGQGKGAQERQVGPQR